MLNKIKNLIKKAGITNTIDDSSNYSRAQVGYLGKTSPIETIFPYGLYAVAPIGSEVLLFSIMGQEENLAGIPNAPSIRIKGLKEGEVAIGNPLAECFIKFDQDGNITQVAKKDILINCDGDFSVDAKKSIKLKGEDVQIITPTGSFNLAGGLSELESSTFNTHTTGDTNFKSDEDLILEGRDVKIIKDGVEINLDSISEALNLATNAIIDNDQNVVFIENTINKLEQNRLISEIQSNAKIDYNKIIDLAVKNCLMIQNEKNSLVVGGWADSFGEIKSKNDASSPDFSSFRNGISSYSFPPSYLTEVFVNFHVPHDYVLGTMIYPHVHWSTSGTNTGAVSWCFEYTYASGYGIEAFGETQTIEVAQPFNGTPYTHMIAEPSEGDGLLIPGMEADGIILFRIYRNTESVNDTQTQAAFMFNCDFHYCSSGLLTNERNRSFTPKRGF